MSSTSEHFQLLNSEIEKRHSFDDLENIIKLCKRGMEQLREDSNEITEIPRFLPCRDILIQSYAMLDQFDNARVTADEAYKAGTYHINVYQAVLKRIDEMEKVHYHMFACLQEDPGLPVDEVRERLQCDKKALEWYITNSKNIRKEWKEDSLFLHLSSEEHSVDPEMKAALVDVETTGLSKVKDEIVEIGVMFVRINRRNGELMEVIEELNELNEPSFPIPERVSNIHGIRDEDVKGKQITYKRFEKVFAQSDLIIAHNAGFDSGFIQRYFPSTQFKPWHCSVRGIQWKQYGFKTRKLVDLCRYHRITNHQTHRALDDVKLTLALLQKKNPWGDYYLKELLKRPIDFPLPQS